MGKMPKRKIPSKPAFVVTAVALLAAISCVLLAIGEGVPKYSVGNRWTWRVNATARFLIFRKPI
jgi:hypothetical protein